jgi:hypothetical protein
MFVGELQCRIRRQKVALRYRISNWSMGHGSNESPKLMGFMGQFGLTKGIRLKLSVVARDTYIFQLLLSRIYRDSVQDFLRDRILSFTCSLGHLNANVSKRAASIVILCL